MSDGKVCIAMSGGVDSSVAALLLGEEGMDRIGATMVLGTPEDEANVQSAQAVCAALGIPHTTFDLPRDFEEAVKEPFLDAYRSGLTPNPCVTCNRTIKFGTFVAKAAEMGCERIATGHYVRSQGAHETFRLLRGADPVKDQSYFLSQVSPGCLQKALFPVGGLPKPEVKAIAEEAGLPVAHREESQDICFIPRSCPDYLREHLGTQPGDILDAHGARIGSHDGSYLFTLGQRKGLGVALGYPAYVCAKDAQANTVTLGSREDALTNEVYLKDLNWLTPKAKGPVSCRVKLRYNMEPIPCTLTPDLSGAHLSFQEPTLAPAPGQTAALYDEETLICGAEIL